MTPGEPPVLSVVIPTIDYHSARLAWTMEALHAHTPAPFEAIIIDHQACPHGYVAAMNQGIRAASGRYLVLGNDDVVVRPEWWPPLQAALDAGATFAYPYSEDGHTFTPDRFWNAWWLATTGTAIRQWAHTADDFFNPAYTHIGADNELYMRLKDAGVPPTLVTESHCYHHDNQSAQTADPELKRWLVGVTEADRAHLYAEWGRET